MSLLCSSEEETEVQNKYPSRRGGRENRDGRDGRDIRSSRDARSSRDGHDGREIRDGRDVRDIREIREGRERYDPFERYCRQLGYHSFIIFAPWVQPVFAGSCIMIIRQN